MMGSPLDEVGRFDREGPQHEVTLTRGYWMAQTPCTQALWEAVMGANPSELKSPERPVENVSWDDVQEFIERLEQRVPGLGAGLPTEAQWEYACRAGTEAAIYAEPLEEIAWYAGNSDGGTREVGDKRANAWGLHDTLGNVFEWCSDGQRRYGVGPVSDPVGPPGPGRVVRGGSWSFSARLARAASRLWYEPGFRLGRIGFRLARGQKQRS